MCFNSFQLGLDITTTRMPWWERSRSITLSILSYLFHSIYTNLTFWHEHIHVIPQYNHWKQPAHRAHPAKQLDSHDITPRQVLRAAVLFGILKCDGPKPMIWWKKSCITSNVQTLHRWFHKTNSYELVSWISALSAQAVLSSSAWNDVLFQRN